jgi:2-polyprenyl-3-methyl-5-hydroxy-6-metoxy-1,4-benzoquinol methylase
MAHIFLENIKPVEGSTLIDVGCGTGRGARVLANAGLKVTGLDFAQNCLDKGVAESGDFTFIETDLTRPIHIKAEYGFCTDVMEHISPEDVDKVLENIRGAVKKAFIHIATEPDRLGDRLVGYPLHLTVEKLPWWREKLRKAGFHIKHDFETPTSCLFYAYT